MYQVSAQGINERMIRCTLLFLNIDTALEVRDSMVLPNHCKAKLISLSTNDLFVQNASASHNYTGSYKLSVAMLRPQKYYGN